MKGDFTRITFDPKKHLSGVLKQQGRVDLDADWNELVDILAYRLNQQTIDTIGATGIPRPPGLNPALGFQISADQNGAVTVTDGKIYVDGLLCEKGPPADGYYVPVMPTVDISTLAKGSTAQALVYIDVWKRHVSCLEDPGLLEKALSGPDTTTRIQTAWQIRAIKDPQYPGDCTPVTDVPPASEALLSWQSVQAATGAPCATGGEGGYTGLENRLYRVEIHDATPPTFKWSRDNNSVGLAIKDVVSADNFKLEVDQLGAEDRDRYYHHWVELISDEAEYAAGHGLLAQVTQIDEINGIITLDQPATDFANKTNTHLRMRRWDMPFGVAATPPSCQLGTWITLEDNVQINFGRTSAGLAAPKFFSGDYWTFTARTVDSMVEPKNIVPPQGIQHHYCKLGFVTWAKDGAGTVTVTATQCVPTFPSLTNLPGASQCNCCIELDGTKDLQQQLNDAAAQLTKSGGGSILLPPGLQVLYGPVTIAGPDISVEGCAGQTTILFTPKNGTDPAFVIDGSPATRVKLYGFDLYASGTGPLVQVLHALDTTIEKCRLVNLPSGLAWTEVIEATQAVTGLLIRDCDLVGDVSLISLAGELVTRLTDVRIDRCRILTRLIGVWLEAVFGFTLQDSTVRGLTAQDWSRLLDMGNPKNLKGGTAAISAVLDRWLEPQPSPDELTIAEVTSTVTQTNELDAVRTAGIAVGGLLPVGVALLKSSNIQISDSQVEAAAPVWGAMLSDLLVRQSVLAGLFGLVLANSSEVSVANCKFAAFLDAIVGGGVVWTWRLIDNVIFGRVGVLVSSEAEAAFRLFMTLRAVAAGLADPVPEWAAWTHPLTFDPGPAGYAGGTTLLKRLVGRVQLPRTQAADVRRLEARGNFIAGADIGFMIDDPGGVSDLGQAAVVENQLIGCRAVGIHVKAANPAGETAIRGNHLEASGVGVRVAAAGTLAQANQVVVLGRAVLLPVETGPLKELANAVGFTVPSFPPLGLSYPPTVRALFDKTVASINSGSAASAGPLGQVVNTTLKGLDYEMELVNYCVARLAAKDFTTAAIAMQAFSEVFMGIVDAVGVTIESPYASVFDNLVLGQGTARGGIVLDITPAGTQGPFLAVPPAGPGAATLAGTFLAVGSSKPAALDLAALPVGPTIERSPFVLRDLPAAGVAEVELSRNRILLGNGHGIDIRHAAPRVRVLENLIASIAGSGIHESPGVIVDRIEICRNRITECGSATDPMAMNPVTTTVGIGLSFGVEVIIDGNMIDQNGGPGDVTFFGIYVAAAIDVSIRSNTIINNVNTGKTGDGCAIRLWENFGDCMVSDNRFHDNGSGGIWVDNGSTLVIAGNKGSGKPGMLPGAGFVDVKYYFAGSIVNNQFDYDSLQPAYPVMNLAQQGYMTVRNLILMGNRVKGPVVLPTNFDGSEAVVGNIQMALSYTWSVWTQPNFGNYQARFAANIP